MSRLVLINFGSLFHLVTPLLVQLEKTGLGLNVDAQTNSQNAINEHNNNKFTVIIAFMNSIYIFWCVCCQKNLIKIDTF